MDVVPCAPAALLCSAAGVASIAAICLGSACMVLCAFDC